MLNAALRLAVRLYVARAWGLPLDAVGIAAVDAAGAAGLPGETPIFDDAAWAAAPDLSVADAVERRGSVSEAVRVGRRDAGRFYTPDAIVASLAKAAVGRGVGPVLDPACGDGRLLLAVAARGVDRAQLHGVDRDPVSVEWTRARLAVALSTPGERWGPGPRIACGDSLLGPIEAGPAWKLRFADPPDGALVWAEVFPEAFAAGGFAAVIGNPPWIAHAGRAARPLDPAVRAWLLDDEPAFHGYRTTHGAFVGRGVRLLRPGGRLVLLLPTSVADLDGYAPVRAALSRHATVAGRLKTFAERAFPGVFQPCVRLVARRRAESAPDPRPWRLDSDGPADALAALPTLPAHLFVDVGVQTDRTLRDALRDAPDAGSTLPLRGGRDVTAWAAGPPQHWIDPTRLGRRHQGGWAHIGAVVRQTARFPIAAPNDGSAFRNSLLGVRHDEDWPVALVCALLNSATVRAWHQSRWRDAREGMPQVKVGHLRAIPAPPRLAVVRAPLIAAAEARMAGDITKDAEIDALVFEAYRVG